MNPILHNMVQDVPDDNLLALSEELRSAVRAAAWQRKPAGMPTVSWQGYLSDLTGLRDELALEIYDRGDAST